MAMQIADVEMADTHQLHSMDMSHGGHALKAEALGMSREDILRLKELSVRQR